MKFPNDFKKSKSRKLSPKSKKQYLKSNFPAISGGKFGTLPPYGVERIRSSAKILRHFMGIEQMPEKHFAKDKSVSGGKTEG